MLKRRIIPIELFQSGRLWKSVRFVDHRDVGHPVKASQVYSNQDADELLFLNINRTDRCVEQILEVVRDIAQTCFVPLSVGGGIRSVDDASKLFEIGTDKVVVNSIVYNHPEIIREISNRHGSQAVVVSIDVAKSREGRYVTFSNCGRDAQNVDLLDHLQSVLDSGAGEIMIQSIDQDGSMSGYDLELLDTVGQATDIPIILAGGAGNFMDLKDALLRGADAVACGSLFNFGDNNPLRAKAFLKNHSIPLKRV